MPANPVESITLLMFPFGIYSIFMNLLVMVANGLLLRLLKRRKNQNSEFIRILGSSKPLFYVLICLSIVSFPLSLILFYYSIICLLYKREQDTNRKLQVSMNILKILIIVLIPSSVMLLLIKEGSILGIIYTGLSLIIGGFLYRFIFNQNPEKIRDRMESHKKTGIAVSILLIIFTSSLFVIQYSPKIPKSVEGIENSVDPLNLKIMTYNIRLPATEQNPLNNWDNRKPFFVEYLDSIKADIIGVQEAYYRQLVYIAMNFQPYEYGYYGVGRDNGAFGGEFSAIFFRTDKFRLIDGGTFWLSSTPSVPSRTWGNVNYRICTWIRLEHRETKKQFFVFNTHFDFSVEFHINAATLIQEFISKNTGDLPVFLMGDFNLNNSHESYSYLDNFGTKPLQDSYKLIHGTPIPFDYSVSKFDASYVPTSDRRIDYIFISNHIQPLNISIPKDSYGQNLTYSDHYPVILECVL